MFVKHKTNLKTFIFKSLIVASISASFPISGFSFSSFTKPSVDTIEGSYIVVLSSKTSSQLVKLSQKERLGIVEKKIHELKKGFKFDVKFRYDACLQGFSAKMDKATAELLSHHPMIELVELDHKAYTQAQSLPLGIDRIDGDISSTYAGDGSGVVSGIVSGVDIFIIDTGIQTNHLDLKVSGGVNFSGGNSYEDPNGHGTHVAGIAAAKDNSSYVVGAAPGADLYAVRVLGSNGSGSFSQVLAGVNWVTNKKLANPTRPMVANMSLGGYAGTSTYNSLDLGIRNSIARGVVYAIAAGNSAINVSNFSPAHVVEALTVGAYSSTSNMWATFSNYGSIVDMLAPGVNVVSTYKGSSTNTFSGTSMATPHVAGAAALYLSNNPLSTPSEVRSALLDASLNPIPGPNPNIRGVRIGTINKSVYLGNF